MPDPIRTIAVIGAGHRGREFALLCIAAGYTVHLEDVMPSNLRKAEAAFVELGSVDGRMHLANTVEDAVRTADFAIDFVPDELESKLEIFCMIDRMAPPRTMLLTPSEALSITDLASCTYRSERCFAVRGDLAGGSSVRLITPKTQAPAPVEQVRDLLLSLGLSVTVEADADAPMLVKNYL